MLDRLFSYLAPHHCCVCGEIGTLFCANCENDIILEPYAACLQCGRLSASNACMNCRLPYQKAWCIGERIDGLERLLDISKFAPARAGYGRLANMMAHVVGYLPPDTVVVPVPTVYAHVRQRGYDHTWILARQFAHSLGVSSKPIVKRRGCDRQRDASREQRIAQARRSFVVEGVVDPTVPYLVVDDIVTTGATVYYASKALRDAGAKTVWVAVAARQTHK